MSSASPISTENHGGEPTHTAATSSAEATAAAAPAPAPTTASQEGNKVPLIVVGTEEHGPFVPPKLEDIHDVKPALKKHAVDGEVVMADAADVEGVDGEAGHPHDSHAKKALQWDEKAIEEHDLLRGTRMKVRTSRRTNCCKIASSRFLNRCNKDVHRIDAALECVFPQCFDKEGYQTN